MRRIFSMKNWDILTRNKSLAMVATFGLFAVWLLLPDDLLKTMALHGFLWGSFSLSVIVMESADPQRVPKFSQRMPNWASILLIYGTAIQILLWYISVKLE